jgi:hypothetical protein
MEFKCNKIKLNKNSFHYNVYDEVIENYDNNDFDKTVYENFFEENFELIKDDTNENFEKYNSDFSTYKGSFIKLCILKKKIFEIEKDIYIFIYHDYHKLIIFYLKNDSKNLELAKNVWINDLYYGNYLETDYTFDILEKNKEKFVVKKLQMYEETEIIVQKNLNIIEKKIFL